MTAHALTLARIAAILGLNALTALGAGDALSHAALPAVDPASLTQRSPAQR